MRAEPPRGQGPGPATQISLETLVVARELHGGDFTFSPLAELARVAHGDAEALDELHFFLCNYLPGIPPEAIAAYAAAPADDGGAAPTLLHVDVPLARPDLPRRGNRRLLPPLSIPCVVVPADPTRGPEERGDRWVIVLPLRHVLHVPAGADLEATLRAEIQRLVSAEERSPQDYLELLPAAETTLQRLALTIEIPERMPPGRAAGLRKALAEQARRRDAVEILRSVSTPLPQRLRPPTLVGRAAELAQLGALLTGPERLGVLLSGRPGCGKTALFLTWLAEAGRGGRAPLVFCTSGAQLIAGMSGLGQWQERLRRVLDAAEALDAILYFESLADLFAEREGSHVDLPGAMRPYVAEGRVRVCGELAEGAMDLGEARHVGFFGALSRLRVPDLDAARTGEALSARAALDRSRSDRRAALLPEAIPVLLDLCGRYQPYQAFPGKAFRLYEEILGVCEKLPPPPPPPGRPVASGAAAGQVPVGPELVLSVFSRHSGIPAVLLLRERPLLLGDVIAALRRRVIGQAEAVRHVAETLCRVKAGLQREGRPLATFLFAGPTGVGKTELARALCHFLFAGAPQPEARMIRFDMSEFTGPEAAARLIRGAGADPDGLLTRKVREQPFCVLLLDEIEKAHPQVFDLLLQVLGEGRLTDGRGRTTSFENAIVIMTSNLGAGGPRPGAGFATSDGAAGQEAHYLREVRRAFRPEFVGRLDRIIPFAPLSQAEVAQVARLQVARIGERRGLRDLGASLTVSEAALRHLGAEGYDAALGARQMRRCLEDRLVAPLARLLGALGPAARGAEVRVRLASEEASREPPLGARGAGALHLAVYRGQGGALRGGRVRSVSDLSALRRLGERLLALDRVGEVRDRVELLSAQLTQAARAAQRRRNRGAEPPLKDVGLIQAEHDRLRRPYTLATEALAELRELEELAISVAMEGEDPAELLATGAARSATLREAALRLLLALEPRRDEITLLVEELEGRWGLDLWLGGLLQIAQRRGWQLTLHLDNDHGEAQQVPLPGEGRRRFGPPRSAEDGYQRLQETEYVRRAVVVIVSGPDAATLLGLEAGRLRFSGVSDRPSEIHCALVALRGRFTDEEWASAALTPQAVQLRAAQPPLSRTVDLERDEVAIASVREPKVPLLRQGYFERLSEIALQHLLLCEEVFGAPLRREDLYRARLPEVPAPRRAQGGS